MRNVVSARNQIFFAFLAITLIAFAFGIPQNSLTQISQPTISEVVKSVEARYHSSSTLKAVFLERYNEGRLTTRVESGTAYFSRPGRMRWEYESPEEKLFLTDGKTTWYYVPADRTASRISMKESNDWRTPLALITGKANLNKYCKHLEFGDPPHDNPANVILRCTPAGVSESRKKSSGVAALPDDQALSPDSVAQVQLVLLEVDPRNGWLAGVTIRQAGGVVMEYRFGRWEANSDVPESKFHFVAPKGVAIVNGDAPTAPVH